MTGLLLRFLSGGTIVAALPAVAGRFGPRTAALLLLFPALTACALGALGIERGARVMGVTAAGALQGTLAFAVFLTVVAFLGVRGAPVVPAVAAGLVAWVLVAAVVVYGPRLVSTAAVLVVWGLSVGLLWRRGRTERGIPPVA